MTTGDAKRRVSVLAVAACTAALGPFVADVPAAGDTIVPGGDVSGVWRADGSPYRVEGDIRIPAGATLVVEPGVEVVFESWYALTIHGRFVAVGSRQEPILFTAPEPGGGRPGWLGLRFVDAEDQSWLSHCIVENGRARAAEPFDRGGAIYCDNSDPIITDCTLRNNWVSTFGGAIFCRRSAPLIVRTLIVDNLVGYSTGGSGGALYCVDSQPRVIGNVICNNEVGVFGGYLSARGSGGAILLDGCAGTVGNNVIAGNVVHAEGNVGTEARGGGIFCRDSNSLIVNNTLSNNRVSVFTQDGDGGAIYLQRSDPILVNTIVEGSRGEGAVYFDQSPGATIAFGDFWANEGGDFAGDTVPPGLGVPARLNANEDPCDPFFNIFLPPRFLDTDRNDYHLGDASRCIGAGWPGRALLPFDFDLDPRPNPAGSHPDIGADEHPAAEPLDGPD